MFTDYWTLNPTPDAGAVITGQGYRITMLTNRLIRFEYEPENRFLDGATKLAINRHFPVPEYTCTEKDDALIIETDSVRIRYDRRPFSATGLTASFKGRMLNHGAIWVYGQSVRNLGGTARTLDRANGEIPLEEGIMSLEGFATLDDSQSMLLDEQGNLQPAMDHGIDLYLFAYGWNFKDALRDFYRLSGAMPMIPRYALGNWWSRYYPYTEESYRTLIERFRDEAVPLSVSVLDMDWHLTEIDPKYGAGWTGYTWNREYFPDPEGFLAWLHEQHLHVTLNEHPADGVRAYEEIYPALAEAMGIDPASGEPVEFDASDAHFLETFERFVLDTFRKTGVDFWWLDWQQRGGSSVAGVDPLFVLNHTRWLYENSHGERSMTFSRYGGPGSHRYPVGFSGDTWITWESLQFQPYFTATAANIGYGWWSHDIGGHMLGIRDESLTVRWVQFGVFSPIMRLHASLNEFLRKEPWCYSMEGEAIMKDFLRLRHRLTPWLYDQAVRVTETGSVMLYPLYYDYKSFDALESQRQAYIFGDEMLVAPILTPESQDTRLGATAFYMPEGEWIDFFTGWRYHGGQCIRVFRPLSGMPVFVRPGTIIPMDGADVLSNGCPLPEMLSFRIFAGANGSHTLIEDNGQSPVSPLYSRCETRCSITVTADGGMKVMIDAPNGAADILPANRQTRIELVDVPNRLPDACSCPVSGRYDSIRRTLTLMLNAAPGEAVSLQWHDLSCPALDKRTLLYDMLLPVRMDNQVKEKILNLSQSLPTSEQRIAAYSCLDLPDGLLGALIEMELID
ncbi:MAG: DUF4968 domain-containing protein [Clostridia bacterium]|nr:DUF4968 domain-containing protein [Clostridia bacterium]